MKDKIVFLDFDGVVNSPLWAYYPRTNSFRNAYAFPEDGFVNNFQAICWLNELYHKCPFDIVITSSWRECQDKYTCEECLRNGGLFNEIQIIGEIGYGYKREVLIKKWIEEKNYQGAYVIFDDEDYYSHDEIRDHLVITNPEFGITHKDYEKAFLILGEHKWYDTQGV